MWYIYINEIYCKFYFCVILYDIEEVRYTVSRRIEISAEDTNIFKKATNSQYSSTLYKQLERDKRLDRFIVALQTCALRGMSLSEACKYLTTLFPSYVRGKGLNPKTLGDMIAFYPELDDAWGFSTDIVQMTAYNRAKALMQTTDDIEVIGKFNEMYDKGDMLYIREEKDSEKSGSSDNVTQVNLFNSRSGVEENE